MGAPGGSRFLLVFAALVLGGFSCLSLLSYLRARQLMDRQITANMLPLTSDAILASLKHELLQPVLASGLMARNPLLEEVIEQGERNPDQIRDYLSRIQLRTGVVTTFLVSDRTHRYYHPSGILKTISPTDPQDRWYFRFRDSGRGVEVNIDRDTADLNRTTAFINMRMEGARGHLLGVTGLGLDVHTLQAQLRHIQRRYAARILVVDQQGHIVIASEAMARSLSQLAGIGQHSASILHRPSTTLRLSEGGRDLYVRTSRLPEIGWTLVVIQQRTADQRAFLDLLAQNLAVAVAISLILLLLAQLTLGCDHRRLALLARTDPLSGLLNRSVFEPLLQHLVAQAQRRGEPLAVAIMDIDHFKRINDRHGHLTGDEVIRHVSNRLRAHLRQADPLFRWGGEEFLLLLPGCSAEEARERLEQIRRDLRSHPLPPLTAAAPAPSTASSAVPSGSAEQPPPPMVTLSFGLTLHQEGESSSDLLQRADRALYQAKRSGRDRICTLLPPAVAQVA